MLHHHPELVNMAALPNDKPAISLPTTCIRRGPDGCLARASCRPPVGPRLKKGVLLAADYTCGVTEAIRKEFPNVKVKA